MRANSETFLGRWMVANSVAEAAGLGTTFVVGGMLAPIFEPTPGASSILLAAIIAVALGALLEGVVVGAGQEWVLRSEVALLPRRAWIRATAIGAALAWSLGMLPSTIIALTTSDADAALSEPSALITYTLAAGLGFVAGPVLAIVQWTVLRRHVAGAGAWLWANAVAWGVGMPLIFFGMDYVPWAGPLLPRATTIYFVCAVTGAVVGAIHGSVLMRLLQRPREDVRSSNLRTAHAGASFK